MIDSPLKAEDIAQVQEFVLAERRKCLSEREWQYRLRGYGYGLSETGGKRFLVALRGNAALFEIDDALLAAS